MWYGDVTLVVYHRAIRNASATPRRNPKPSWSASSTPAATRATSFWTPSAAAALLSPPPSASNRRWIGIDITHIAITLIRHRIEDTFKGELKPYEVLGQPQDVASAQALATDSENSGRYQFEWWALGLVDARPAQDRKKGADSGIDGYINFFDDNSGKAKRIVAQVKSGHVTRNQIATLKGDMEREKAEIGLFITLQPPTGPMEAEATSAGLYTPEHYPDTHYPPHPDTHHRGTAERNPGRIPPTRPRGHLPPRPRRRRSTGAQSSFA